MTLVSHAPDLSNDIQKTSYFSANPGQMVRVCPFWSGRDHLMPGHPLAAGRGPGSERPGEPWRSRLSMPAIPLRHIAIHTIASSVRPAAARRGKLLSGELLGRFRGDDQVKQRVRILQHLDAHPGRQGQAVLAQHRLRVGDKPPLEALVRPGLGDDPPPRPALFFPGHDRPLV